MQTCLASHWIIPDSLPISMYSCNICFKNECYCQKSKCIRCLRKMCRQCRFVQNLCKKCYNLYNH